jgi:hypothetical protein
MPPRISRRLSRLHLEGTESFVRPKRRIPIEPQSRPIKHHFPPEVKILKAETRRKTPAFPHRGTRLRRTRAIVSGAHRNSSRRVVIEFPIGPILFLSPAWTTSLR